MLLLDFKSVQYSSENDSKTVSVVNVYMKCPSFLFLFFLTPSQQIKGLIYLCCLPAFFTVSIFRREIVVNDIQTHTQARRTEKKSTTKFCDGMCVYYSVATASKET